MGWGKHLVGEKKDDDREGFRELRHWNSKTSIIKRVDFNDEGEKEWHEMKTGEKDEPINQFVGTRGY